MSQVLESNMVGDSHSTNCDLGQLEAPSHDTLSATLSIRRRMALYPRERLFVHPFRWSERQFFLLGCKFINTGDNTDEILQDDPVGGETNKTEQATAQPKTFDEVWDMGPAACMAFARNWFERMLYLEAILHSISSRRLARL